MAFPGLVGVKRFALFLQSLRGSRQVASSRENGGNPRTFLLGAAGYGSAAHRHIPLFRPRVVVTAPENHAGLIQRGLVRPNLADTLPTDLFRVDLRLMQLLEQSAV